MNLIAYEMCLDFENDFGISSYISFLDSLINEADDVRDMSKAGLLHNFLGSDQQLVDVINEIGTQLVPNEEAFKEVKIQIHYYYENDRMARMAKLLYDYFNRPWSIISMFYSVLSLSRSATRAWYAVDDPSPGPCNCFRKKEA